MEHDLCGALLSVPNLEYCWDCQSTSIGDPGEIQAMVFFLLILLAGAVLPAWATESVSHADPAMELERMDQRTPVPLGPHMALHQKQNMRNHLEAIQTIVAGLAKQDFPAIEAAAARMGFSREMEGMCQRMGAGAPGFSDRAIKFHKTADEIAVYARKKDEKGVLDSLNRTLAQCVGCHATYRQQIVDVAHPAH